MLRTLSGSCSRNNVLSTASVRYSSTKFRSFCRKFEGFSSASSFPRNSFCNWDSLVSANDPIILCFRVLYLFSVGGAAIISETKGNTAWSRWTMTYLYFVSSLVILDNANTVSTCPNHNIGFSFQNWGNFIRRAALITSVLCSLP